MPNNPRSRMKKKCAHILQNWDRSLVILDDLYETFAAQHTEYAEYLAAIITNLLQNREFLLDFWRLAWGEAPEDYTTWL